MAHISVVNIGEKFPVKAGSDTSMTRIRNMSISQYTRAGKPFFAVTAPFVLGHALHMKAIHGGKAKNDRIDSEKIVEILRGGHNKIGNAHLKWAFSEAAVFFFVKMSGRKKGIRGLYQNREKEKRCRLSLKNSDALFIICLLGYWSRRITDEHRLVYFQDQ